MKPKHIISWPVFVALLLVQMDFVYCSDDLPVEREFAQLGNQTYLTVVENTDQGSISAQTKLPALGPPELTKIKYKPGGTKGSLFRFYYFRDGVLAGLYEYTWSAPPNSLSFQKTAERRIVFSNGVVAEGRQYLNTTDEADILLTEASSLYEEIRRAKTRTKHKAN